MPRLEILDDFIDDDFDAGMDQTMVQFMSDEDKEIRTEEIMEEIMTLLGLTRAPKNKVHKVELGNHTVIQLTSKYVQWSLVIRTVRDYPA